jgi:hypothetical protein
MRVGGGQGMAIIFENQLMGTMTFTVRPNRRRHRRRTRRRLCYRRDRSGG